MDPHTAVAAKAVSSLKDKLKNKTIILSTAHPAKFPNALKKAGINSDNIPANLAEVISYQQEKPVPFFIHSPFSQSEDEKFQQNKILTEWLENIFIHGAIEKKEMAN
mgnify:CR=1 FL=1